MNLLQQQKTGYKYVYAGLTWEQYWASEGVYNACKHQLPMQQQTDMVN